MKITFEYRFTGEEPPAPPEPVVTEAPRSAEPARSSSAAKTETAPAKPENAAPVISAAEMEEFKNDPLIKKALEVFQAQILGDQGGATA